MMRPFEAPVALAMLTLTSMLRRARRQFGDSVAVVELAPIAVIGVMRWSVSRGRAMPGVELRIIDRQGRPLGVDEPGEIVVRGPNVSPGYLNRPAAMAKAYADGWFRSGDIGYLDEHDYLYLLDRKKDLVITGGELVYSLEVEAALAWVAPGGLTASWPHSKPSPE